MTDPNLESIALRECRSLTGKDFIPVVGLYKYYNHYLDTSSANYRRFKPLTIQEIITYEKKRFSALPNVLLLLFYNSFVISSSTILIGYLTN